MRNFGWAAGAAAAMMLLAGSAQAAVRTVTWTIDTGTWITEPGGGQPYGLDPQPVGLTGIMTVEDTLEDGSAFLTLNFTAGTRTFTEADINRGASSLAFLHPTTLVNGFYLYLTGDPSPTGLPNFLGGDVNGSLSLGDSTGAMYCNGCFHVLVDGSADPVVVDTTPIPEPTTWALLIAGFGLAGGALRRQRRPLTA